MEKVDHVIVRKAARTLYLCRGQAVLKTYCVALGRQPRGHKRRSGDSRMPEGLYRLDWCNPDSRFFRSIQGSCPNDGDRRAARERGEDPGGEIMIHG